MQIATCASPQVDLVNITANCIITIVIIILNITGLAKKFI